MKGIQRVLLTAGVDQLDFETCGKPLGTLCNFRLLRTLFNHARERWQFVNRYSPWRNI